MLQPFSIPRIPPTGHQSIRISSSCNDDTEENDVGDDDDDDDDDGDKYCP